jgi:hypothetical protein
MRIVLVIQSFMDLDTLAKCAELRNRQHGWITQHVAKTAINLDKKDIEFGTSLQNLLMDIPSSTGNKSLPLFLSIDKSWKGSGYTFSFHPDKNDEASVTIKGLYTRLAHIHGDKIHKYFTPPAIEAGVRMTWDPITKFFSLVEDREVNDLLGLDDAMTFTIPASSETEAELGKRKIVFCAKNTEDSVLTFTEGSKRPLPGEIVVQTKKKRKSTNDMDTDESASTTSSKVSSRASDKSTLSLRARKTIDSRISTTIGSGLS